MFENRWIRADRRQAAFDSYKERVTNEVPYYASFSANSEHSSCIVYMNTSKLIPCQRASGAP